MKLLYCIPALYNTGGMERVLTEKMNFLVNIQGYDITIVTTDHKEEQPICFPLDKRVKLVHLQLDYVGHFTYPLIKKYIAHTRKQRVYKKLLKQLINEQGFDVCISLCGKEVDFLGKLDVACVKMAEIHFAMNVRSQFLDARHTGLLWKWIGDIRTAQLVRSVKLLDKFVVLTEQDARQWRSKGCTNVAVIHNPCPFVNPPIGTLETKRVISVGRLEPQKGYDMLIETWQFVAKNFPDWELVIFGNGQDYEKLKQQIKRCGLENMVHLCGTTDNLEVEYAKSSIYVMSSRYEGLPMSLIESMSCGLPVVSFDCEQGPRELITDGENGFLVAPNDTKALADALCRLMADTSLRKTMGAKAKEFSKSFATDKIMAQWTDLFNQLKKKA